MKRMKPLTQRSIVSGQPAGDDTIRTTTSPLRRLGPTVIGIVVCGLLAAAPPLAATATAQTAGPVLTALSGPEHGYSAGRPVTNPSSMQSVDAASRADQAINWFQARFGETSFHMKCEMAVENAYGSSRYLTALDDWRAAVSQGRAHPGDLNAPRGALVFWDITQPYGHVGISRGDGTFVATDVTNNATAIGAARLPDFSHYLGWAYPKL
ncbi:MAG: hypothetical protein ACRDUW_07385 [Pseudonocardiaceae bacterium]